MLALQTNKDVVCQIFSSDVKHDICLAAAYSHELKRFGITTGLTNYAAAYATGLLLARRIDAKYQLGYKGSVQVDGKEFHVEVFYMKFESCFCMCSRPPTYSHFIND